MSTTIIQTIPHCRQRYETPGDWEVFNDGSTAIKVSMLENSDYEFLIGLHELVECYLCKKRGIKDADVTAFDEAFEANRPPGNTAEPGDDPRAPYARQHRTATIVEMIVADALEVDWSAYAAAVVALLPK